MKTFILANLDYETLQEFIQFSNDYWDFPWCIIIDSEGGLGYVSENIRYIIGQHASIPELVTIVKANHIYDEAFMLFHTLSEDVERLLTFGCIGKVSLGEGSVTLNTLNKSVRESDKCLVSTLKIVRNKERFFIDKILNDKEKKQYFKGDDVWLDFERIKNIYPKLIIA